MVGSYVVLNEHSGNLWHRHLCTQSFRCLQLEAPEVQHCRTDAKRFLKCVSWNSLRDASSSFSSYLVIVGLTSSLLGWIASLKLYWTPGWNNRLIRARSLTSYGLRPPSERTEYLVFSSLCGIWPIWEWSPLVNANFKLYGILCEVSRHASNLVGLLCYKCFSRIFVVVLQESIVSMSFLNCLEFLILELFFWNGH